MDTRNYTNVGIYVRVSTREQAMGGYSIDMQKEKCKQYLDLFDFGYKSLKYYVDEGKSAKSFDRPEIQRLLNDINDNKLDLIVIYKLDRLSRNVIDVYKFIENMLGKKVNLFCVIDNIDITSANGRLIVGTLAMISHWERENVAERTLDALHQMCREGKFPIGYTPFGYCKDKNNYLSIDEEKSIIVKRVYSLAIEGMPTHSIPKTIYEEFNFTLKANTITKILNKTLYYGNFSFKSIKYENIVPMIIDKDTYVLANKMKDKRRKTKVNDNYILRNKVRCVCGNVLEGKSTRKKDRNYFYYYCKSCNKRILQDILIEQIIMHLLLLINQATLNATQKRYLKKLNNIDYDIKKKYEAYIESSDNEKLFYYNLSQYNKKKDEIKSKLDSVSKYEIGYLDSIWWQSLSNEQKSKIINDYISFISVELTTKQIVYTTFKKKLTLK